MDIYNDNEIEEFMYKIKNRILAGEIFIYPTDTIYGIGCDATNDLAVKRVREAKKRDSKPFSIIAPNIEWIHQNCVVKNVHKEWLSKLPGAYTLVFELKDKDLLPKDVNRGMTSIGVRIPNHWISKLSEDLDVPIITTSVNLTGEKPMINISDADKFEESVDFLLYEGELKGNASTVVLLNKDEVEVIKR